MFKYGIDQLTVDKVIAIANGTLKAEITSDAERKINECRKKVEVMANSDVATYGINTGFGPLCDVQISPAETSKLTRKLINYSCSWCW